MLTSFPSHMLTSIPSSCCHPQTSLQVPQPSSPWPEIHESIRKCLISFLVGIYCTGMETSKILFRDWILLVFHYVMKDRGCSCKFYKTWSTFQKITWAPSMFHQFIRHICLSSRNECQFFFLLFIVVEYARSVNIYTWILFKNYIHDLYFLMCEQTFFVSHGYPL